MRENMVPLPAVCRTDEAVSIPLPGREFSVRSFPMSSLVPFPLSVPFADSGRFPTLTPEGPCRRTVSGFS